MWIDRICINQDDLEERASQVQKMRFICLNCVQAVVWLGREDITTEATFKYMREIHQAFQTAINKGASTSSASIEENDKMPIKCQRL